MTRPLCRLLALLILLTGMFQTWPAAAQPGSTPNGTAQRLNVGDVMQVLLPGEEAFASPFPIDREGRITLPEVGTVEIAGLTLADRKSVV